MVTGELVVAFEESCQLNRILISLLVGDSLLSHLILSWSRHAKVGSEEELITLSLGRGGGHKT